MRKLIFYIIIINLQNLIYSIVPLWNFENTTIKLNLPYSYKFTKYLYDIPLTLEKTFDISENKIFQKNTININNELTINNKDWDNIESFYKYDDYYFICPKGKYNMYKFRKDNQDEWQEIFNLKYDKEWELKCYMHEKIIDNTNLVTIFYLNIKSNIKSYNLGTSEWKGNAEIHSGLLDFKWTTNKKDNNYYMFAIGINGENIDLFSIKSEYNNEFKFNIIKNKTISKNLTYYYACFNGDNLYFVTYNNKTMISGFTNLNGEVTESNFESINMSINDSSPLIFYDEITINKINFIEESQYLYYNISTDKNETYYGIIDIETNKVIYNTNKEISEFKPFSNSSMLAISGSSIYLICTFKSNDDDKCLYKCDNNPLIDTTKPNSCEGECNNYILIPENICIESCDENIFTIKDKTCGLCRDIDEKNKFKVVNTTGCIEEKPKNSYFVNEKLNLIACEERYIFDNGTCKQNFTCGDKCQTCKEEPIEGNQNCLSCKDENDVLQEGNCIKECTNGFYEDSNKTCLKCEENCETCEKNSNNCTSCKDGKYLNENNTCINCHENCKTCVEGEKDGNQSCLTCKENVPFLINVEGYNKNCIDNCSKFNLTPENNFCVKKSDTDDNNNDQTDYMLLIFIIIITIILIVLALIICKRFHRKDDQDLMDNITSELKDKIVD